MKARLNKALAKASDGEALDLKKKLRIGRGAMLSGLQSTVKEGLSAKAQLDDPPLPSKADLPRWYPDQPVPRPPRLLVDPRAPSRPASARTAGPPSRHTVVVAPPASASASSSKRHGVEATGASIAFATRGPNRGKAVASAIGADDEVEPAATASAMRAVLSQWMESYNEDEEAFASKAVFIEMRLRQALACSARIGVPNQFRCAIVCDAWERVVRFPG